jgi:hypothetical protein
MARKSRVLTDHDEIRRWAEERDAQPACVRGTGSAEDVGMIRLDFPGYSGETSLEPIDWDEWLQKFDENNLALLVEDQTSRGEQSNFNKIIGRETAAARSEGRRTSRHAERGSKRKETGATGRRSRSSSRASSRRGKRSRSGGTRATSSRSSRSRSGRSTSARGTSSRSSSSSSRSRTARTTTGKKRAQSVRGKSRSRRRAA